ncbi:TIR domain-containing protein [Photobacterium leiognathi]|uniref:TIR domain-containing protein n=1 Tax=Photobacterium leiognathi TaxID=553611 RepID=UPI0029817F26|nr:TIR domain-containing protein [Photobacterium leiognathi]
MARKTFVSYKYSESVDLRDKIIESLGEEAKYYTGETSESPYLGDLQTETIKDHLKSMIYNTSVIIVILSPEMTKSSWISWELKYALKSIKRGDQNSKPNGIVAVVQKVDGGYDWLITHNPNSNGCSSRRVSKKPLPEIINLNRFNRKETLYHCDNCKTYDSMQDSYISVITEDSFLSNPTYYIENAYEKSASIDEFDIKKQETVNA